MTLAVLLFSAVRRSRSASQPLSGLSERRCMAFVFRAPVFPIGRSVVGRPSVSKAEKSRHYLSSRASEFAFAARRTFKY